MQMSRTHHYFDEFHSVLIVIFPSVVVWDLYTVYSLFGFCLDVQRNACNKNPQKADIQYMDLTAVTCSRNEHLTKQHRNYYGKKSRSKEENKHNMSVPGRF